MSQSNAQFYLNDLGIQDVLNREGINEVSINKPYEILYKRDHVWHFEENEKLSYENLITLANAITISNSSRKKLNEDNPIASVVLPQGERGQIILPPVVKKGHVAMSFRKPSNDRFSLDDYERTGRLNPIISDSKNLELLPFQQEMKELLKRNDTKNFLKKAVENKLNILLVGGTGSGKTTIMKAIVDEYPKDKRLITIEDVHELSLPYHRNHVNMFYKKDGVTPKEVIESCMRLDPDHIFLAELRGDESWSYLEALNTGHTGSVTTIHANDCQSAYSRLTDLIKQSSVGQTLDYDFIMRKIKKSIDVVCSFEKTFIKEVQFLPELKNKILAGE